MRIDRAVPHVALRTFWSDDQDDGNEPEHAGLLNTAVLRRRATDLIPTDGSPHPTTLHYRQFATAVSRDDHVRCGAPATTETAYDLCEVITSGTDLWLDPDLPRINLVTVMTPWPGQLDRLVGFNRDETEHYFRHREGFLAASFHLTPSPDPGRRSGSRLVLEHVQWESLDALSAATATPQFDRHIEENTRYCETTDVGLYDVLSPQVSTSRTDQQVFASRGAVAGPWTARVRPG